MGEVSLSQTTPDTRLVAVIAFAVLAAISSLAFAIGLLVGGRNQTSVVEAVASQKPDEQATAASTEPSALEEGGSSATSTPTQTTTSGEPSASSSTEPVPIVESAPLQVRLFDRPVRQLVGVTSEHLVLLATDGSVHLVSIDGAVLGEISPPSSNPVAAAFSEVSSELMVVSGTRFAVFDLSQPVAAGAVPARNGEFSGDLRSVTAELDGTFAVLDTAGRRWSGEGLATRFDLADWSKIAAAQIHGLGRGWFAASTDAEALSISQLWLLSPNGDLYNCGPQPAASALRVSAEGLVLSDGSVRNPEQCAATLDQGPSLTGELAVARHDGAAVAAVLFADGALQLLNLINDTSVAIDTNSAEALHAPSLDGFVVLGPDGADWIEAP